MSHDDRQLEPLLGLDRLALAKEGWEKAAWEAALRAMQATKHYAVVVVVPPDAAGRKRVAEALARLVHRVRLGVRVGGAGAEAQADELIDPKGKRVAGARRSRSTTPPPSRAASRRCSSATVVSALGRPISGARRAPSSMASVNRTQPA